ncbi:hypothetical protein C1X68_25095 [Pseudomonas sp. FW303-C2]|nr:hypothetical protein C1X68_25095 [Pseudomonas sp. FW303-C2]PNA44498.1 hypothetical protein C1X71_08810 [Pseudomonas sp. FW306-2-2C-A10BC]PNA82469.1 hypothetical protein C1X66_26630 [Pseudomonas sp. MPR-R3B]
MARELAPARLRSSRKPCTCGLPDAIGSNGFGAASQPSGSKLPRHNSRGTKRARTFNFSLPLGGTIQSND